MPVVIPALGQRRRKAKKQKFLPHEACILGDSGSLQPSKTFTFLDPIIAIFQGNLHLMQHLSTDFMELKDQSMQVSV